MDFIVVGIGFFGKKWAELLQKHPLVSLVATVDVNEAAAQWSLETLGTPCFTCLDVIKDPEHSIYALPHSILLDMSVHHFDLLRYMTAREVSSVLAMEHDTPDNAFKHPSNAICLMRLEQDIPVVWDGDWCARSSSVTSWEGEWQFIGSRGRLFWDGNID
jgi:predicted dehydrogenase